MRLCWLAARCGYRGCRCVALHSCCLAKHFRGCLPCGQRLTARPFCVQSMLKATVSGSVPPRFATMQAYALNLQSTTVSCQPELACISGFCAH